MIIIDGKTYGLSAADLAERRGYINASEAPTICGGDSAARARLWQEKTGQIEPEDLSGVLAVQLGSYTESFNAAWFTQATGIAVSDRGGVLKDGFLRATLDGMCEYQGALAVWEAKHIGAFSKIDDAAQRYMPQLFVQMHLSGARQAIISMLHGTQNYEWLHVEWDDAYAASVLAMLADFHTAVALREPPDDAPVIEPLKISEFKPYDFSDRNDWIYHAGDWLENEDAAKKFNSAVKCLKEIIPEDASEVAGGGIIAKRSKAGAISIKGIK